MAWTGLTLTVDGRNALNQAQAANQMNIKSIVVGDGSPPSNFRTMKGLVHQLFEVTDLKLDVVDNKCVLTADFPKVDYDYYFREIGVVVTTEDGDVLYVYDNCGDDAQYIVTSTGVESTQKRIRISLLISDVANITVTSPSILYVGYDEFETEVEKLRQAEEEITALQGQVEELEAGKVDKAGDTMTGALKVEGDVTATKFVGKSTSTDKWANIRNINGMSVDGSANRTNYGVCSTAAATAAKTVSCDGFALVTGAEITVKFTITNTAANPTLNVSNTGAKEIYYRGSKLPGGTHANSQRAFRANGIRTFRYTGSYYELVGDLDADTTYALATTSANGLMSKEDKAKLDGMPKNFEPIIASSQHENPNVQWMEFCDIVIVSAPANQPIEFEFTSKYMAGIGKLSLYFNDAISADATTVNAFYKNQYVPDAFLFNRGGGIWSIYVKRVANDEQTSAFKIKIGDYEKEKVVITMHLVPNDASSIPENKRIYATIPYATGIKGNAESAYRTGNVNLTANNIGALPITGGTMQGPIFMGLETSDTTPAIVWRTKNTFRWIGTGDSSGDNWQIYDENVGRVIISSQTNGYGFAYGGSKVSIYTNSEGGNLQLVSPNGAARSEIDLNNNSRCRWYVQNTKDNSILSYIQLHTDGRLDAYGKDTVSLYGNRNIAGVRIIDIDGTWGLIQAADFSIKSSRRYKENIQAMTKKRAKAILDVEVVTFDYKDGIVNNPLDRTGVIAEEVVGVIPEVVNYTIIDDDKVPDSVDYSKFVPYLIKMVQIQQNEIDRLKLENAALAERLTAIEERLEMDANGTLQDAAMPGA